MLLTQIEQMISHVIFQIVIINVSGSLSGAQEPPGANEV